MKKGDQLLEALAATPGLTVDELVDKIEMDRSKAGALLTYLKSKGRITGAKFAGGGNSLRYSVAGTKAAPPPKRTKGAGKKRTKPVKRAKHKAQTSAPRTIKALARKHLAVVHIPSLAQRHVTTTLNALEACMDLEGADPILAAAFRSHQEAIELLGERA